MEAISTDITIDRLEQLLLEGEAAIAGIRARQVAALRVLDAVQANQQDGSRSMIEWTAARLDVTHATARELLDVAKATAELPRLWESLHTGDASFDRTVATVKLAATGASHEVLEHSRGFDLNGVARLSARHRRMSKHDERAVFLDQFVAIQPTLDHSAARLWGQLPGFEARILEKALRQKGRSVQRPARPEDEAAHARGERPRLHRPGFAVRA